MKDKKHFGLPEKMKKQKPNKSNRYRKITAEIRHDLKYIATQLARKSPSYSIEFEEQLDDVAQHSVKWHQFGILTHTRLTFDYLRKNKLYRELNFPHQVLARIQRHLNKKIGDLTKTELLKIASLLHDIGKFKVRFWDDIKQQFKFKGHEAESAKIAKQYLKNKLTPTQAAYIYKIILLHDEPLELKKNLKQIPSHTIDQEQRLFQNMIKKLGKEAIDILVFFWSDKVAKGVTKAQQEDEQLMKKVLITGLNTILTIHGKN